MLSSAWKNGMKKQIDWHGKVEMIRRAATSKGRAESGYFSIEGVRLHERAVRAGVRVEQAITTLAFKEDPSARIQTLLRNLEQTGCQVSIVHEAVIGEITGGRDLGPILGLIKMPEQPLLGDIYSRSDRLRRVILAAVDVKDPGNVGALLRTAHAAGAVAFIAVGISDPFHPKALRTTMGSLFKLPVLRYDDVPSLLAELKDAGFETVGTAVTGGIPLPQAAFSDTGTAVFVGSEAWGLSEEIQSAVDWLVSIPMYEGVDSFSVNAAAAIVLYEIGHQRFGQQVSSEDRT
jgi:RNA methyltransferase, TrmH family